MAKIEKAALKALKKSKGKKRKHESNDDDAVATKSVILSKEPEPELPPKKQTTKKLKRKAFDDDMENETTKPVNKSKKSKAPSSDEEEDEEIEEPTAEELRESQKPENIKSIVTVRQKKKQKHLQRLEAQKNQLTNKEVARNEEYLQKWKNQRDGWKFEKLRQISIQQSVFDDTKVSAELWPIALEYLSGSKGAAKDKITKSAEAVIDELDKEAEKATDDDGSSAITSSEKYRRARELLQSFD